MGIRSFALLSLLAFVGVGSLVPLPRFNPPVERDVAAPPEVAALLRRACYDCHSNETRWGPQAYVAPVSWLVLYDVVEGRRHLNFSRWGLGPQVPAKLGKMIRYELEQGDMPLLVYELGHPEARLTEAERATLLAWARALERGGERRRPESHAGYRPD